MVRGELETMGKRKTTETLATDEPVTEEPIVAALEPTQPTQTLPETKKTSVLDEAPNLYGNNPTAQELEDFKQREIIWRRKLEQSLT